MKHKNTSVSRGILFKGVLVALLLGMSFASWSQIISTFAGNGSGAYNGDNIQATAAGLDSPEGIAVDASGNVYIADEGNQRIQIINTSGIISTLAGNGFAGYSGDGGAATAAKLFYPTGVAVDASGNVYIADWNNSLIRKVNTSGIISTFAGNYNEGEGYSGDGGAATDAELSYPYDIVLDASGNVYIADGGNNLIRMVNTSGIISTFAGNYNEGVGYSGDGGPATAAELNGPYDIALDASGNLYIADAFNNLIRMVNTSGTISTFAGIASGAIDGSNEGYSGDGGIATAAELNFPTGIAADVSGNIYIADYNNLIRIVNTSGIINTFAGNYNEGAGYSGDGGPATAAELNSPQSIAVDASGNGYIADYNNNVIRKVTVVFNVSGNVTTNVSCNGGNTGSASVSSYLGTTPYTYSWSPIGGTDSTATGLSAGTYTITVTDAGDYTASAMVIITQPVALSTTASVTTDVTCNGGNDGSATASPSDGSTPYTYSWSGGGGTNSVASGLSAGTYTITVSDQCSNSATASVSISQPITLSTTASVTANISCNGENNGSASASPSDGTTPYTYSWSGGGGTNSVAGGLSAGTYTVTVSDQCSSSATASVSITEPAIISVLHDSVADNGSSSGIAAVTVSGGTSPYSYSWTPGGETTDTIKGQSAGTYTCTITDNDSCSQTTSITIKSSTGIESISNSSSVSIYPNPTSGTFTISGISSGQVVNMYNYLGENMSSLVTDNNSNLQLNISDQANGIYLIRVLNKDGTIAYEQKIVKTN